jgi:hypothetical protein
VASLRILDSAAVRLRALDEREQEEYEAEGDEHVDAETGAHESTTMRINATPRHANEKAIAPKKIIATQSLMPIVSPS